MTSLRGALLGVLLGLVDLVIVIWVAEATVGFRVASGGVVWLGFPTALTLGVVGAWEGRRGRNLRRSVLLSIASAAVIYLLGLVAFSGLTILLEYIGLKTTGKLGGGILVLDALIRLVAVVGLLTAGALAVIVRYLAKRTSTAIPAV